MLSYTCSTEGLHILLFVASEFVCCFLYIVYSILLFPSSSSPLPALAQPLPVLCAHRNSPNSISWNGAWLSVGIWVDTKMLSTGNAGNCCYLFFKEWMLIRVWTVITHDTYLLFSESHTIFSICHRILFSTLPCPGCPWAQKIPHISTRLSGNPFGLRSLAVPEQTPPLHKASSGGL